MTAGIDGLLEKGKGMLDKGTERIRSSVPAGVFRTKKTHKYYRKPPATLPLAAIGAVLFSAMYLYRALSYIPQAVTSDSFAAKIWTLSLVVIFFLMFIRFASNMFSLSSGNRAVWAGTVRSSTTYVFLVLMDFIGLRLFDVHVDLGILEIPPVLMAAAMAVLVVYMFLPGIRRFFTPTYAEEVSLWKWIGYAAGNDPFKGTKLTL
ncbi:MAG: hypothetical protein PHI62_01620 [Candidatus Methanomethylophilaceae archaeon]|nr:hypothetical protein [Candidatus Methanomethylophilaceae archaeon]